MYTEYRHMGLGESEARIMGCVASSGTCGAAHIARSLHMSRSSVYTILNALIAKGFVVPVASAGVKRFSAAPISDVALYVERKKKELHSIEHAFESLKRISPKKTASLESAVFFFENQEGMKHAYLTMLRDAAQGAVLRMMRDEFVWGPKWNFVYEDDWSSRIRRWKTQKDIHTRLLVNDSELERSKISFYSKRPGLRYRFLLKKYFVHSYALYVIGNYTLILSLEEQMTVGVLIRNEILAHHHALQFDALWDSSTRASRRRS